MPRSDNPQTRLADLAILIPAYRPDRTLVDFVATLAVIGFPHIVVVNDGSGPDCNPVFESVSKIEGVRVVEHAINLGKGAALKTGINYALCAFRGLAGIVTADADGQHLPEDVLRVAEKFLEHPSALILGARAFEGEVPLRSRFGNTVTRQAVQMLVGARLQDTQTGLRAIPASFAALLLKLTSTGYEFELDMLIAARKDSIELIEQPIQTVYEPGNKSSHFNPLIDSMKIYFVLLRFSSVSLISALVDNVIFYLAYHHGAGILAAQMTSRTTAALFNYLVVRKAVFHVKERHTAAFPKYLALVAISGSISYACIRLVTGTTHMPVFRTKIVVETLLFFANFTVQRDWVFLRSKNAAVIEPPAEPWSFKRAHLLWLLLLIPLGLEIHGFGKAQLLSIPTWNPDGRIRFIRYVGFFAGTSVFFALFARRYFFPAAMAAVVLCSIYAVGVVPVASVLLFVFSATVLGRLCFGNYTEGPLAFLAGTAFWIFAMYLTLHMPVHYPATHLAALALPVVIGYRSSRKLAAQWLGLFRPAATSPGLAEFAASAGLAFVLVANWLIVLKPEVSTDGLAMHLAIPSNIALHHAFTIDFHQFIWALMPIGADLIYSVVYTIGGEYAARLLNFAMLAGIACLLVQTARSFVSKPVAIFMAMLFISTPMVYFTTGSMFVENFVAIMVLGGVAALWRFHETQATRYLMLTSVLLGASMALKLGAGAAGLLGLAILVFEIRRGRAQASRDPDRKQRPLLPAACAVAILLTLGSVPYASAWWQSGNPFFPFQTGPFKSTFVENDIRDLRFNPPISWRTAYDLTFYTSRYYEGQTGSFGFQYFLFLPLMLGSFIAVRSFKARSAILLGGGTALIVAATQPNARYFYFILPLLTLGGASALAWLHEKQLHLFRAAVAAAALACFWNIWLLPSADWYHRDFYSSPLFSEAGRQNYLDGSAPEREVVSFINRARGNEPVVLTDGSEIADVIAPVDSIHWHDYTFLKKVRALPRPVDIYRLFQQRGIGQLIVNGSHKDRWEAGVTSLISVCGQPEFRAGDYLAMKLRPDCEQALVAQPPAYGKCSPNEPLPPGTYDDTDPRITFLGPWTKETKFPETWRKTISYSNAPDGLACLSIEGSGLKYTYTKVFNRGIAEVSVDGEKKALIDLYSKTIQWQAHTTISGLPPGRHEVSIRVTAKKNSAASDYYVDLDSVEVF